MRRTDTYYGYNNDRKIENYIQYLAVPKPLNNIIRRLADKANCLNNPITVYGVKHDGKQIFEIIKLV